MAETESTHEVAEKTGPDGGTTRVETRRTTTETRQDGEKPETGGEPKQVQPDGR